MLIDVPLLAHIAARRSTNVDASAPTEPGSLALLHALAADGKVLRVAADAADPAATAAARSLVDVLNNADVPARIVANELPAIAARSLPAGEVDIVVHWRNDGASADTAAHTPAETLASRIACPAETGRAGNLAGFCSVAGDELAKAILAGDIPPETATERVAAIEHREALWVPLLRETRLAATAGGVRFTLAAGNSGADANTSSPARANGAFIFTVSAFAIGDKWASFSNFGNPPIDAAEPGVAIKSTWLGGGYNTISGTSMAAPHLAGILLAGGVRSGGFVSGDPDGKPDTIGVK